MRRELVPLLAALLLVVPASGCLGGTGEDTSTEAQRVQSQALQSMQSADTYRFDLSMSVEFDRGTATVDAGGVVDRPDRKLRMEMSTRGPGLSQDLTVYLDNQTMYAKIGEMWRTRYVSDRDVWDSRDHLARQQQLLDESTVTLAGNETVDGTTVRVLELEPDAEKLRQQVERQFGDMGDVSLEDVTYRYYVGTESSQVHKIEMDATMSTGGDSGSVSMTLRFSDFGSDVSIRIPEEATGPSAA